MPSADPGAPPVRPADVERWLADLGLEPVDRADRDGIASWDLVLDGRRRFDLRVTVILEPTLAFDLLGALRPAHQRHVPQVVSTPAALERRVPVREVQRGRRRAAAARGRAVDRERPPAAGADGLGLALARIVGIADRLLDESKDWIWIGGREPDPERSGEPQPAAPGPVRRSPAGAVRRGRDLVRRRRLGILLVVLVASWSATLGAPASRRWPRGPT